MAEKGATTLLKHLYVPAASLLLLAFLGKWAVNEGVRSDPYAAANASAQAQLEAQRQASRSDKAVQFLYLGNSQTFTIQKPLPGNLTTPQWVQSFLAHDGDRNAPSVKMYMGSEPNLTLTEAMIRLVSYAEAKPRKADVLILQLVLDGFRMQGVREGVLADAQRPEVHAALADFIRQYGQRYDAARVALTPALVAKAPVSDAGGKDPLTRSSDATEAAAAQWPVFKYRDQLKVQSANAYMHYRNSLLHITSSAQRPIVETSYRANLELFEMILQYGKDHDIPVIVYLAPVRPHIPNPLRPQDIARFRQDTREICTRYQASCVDLIDAVPEQYWTNYPDDNPEAAGQPDFAHFTGAAHKKVAEELVAAIRPNLAKWAQGTGTP